MGLRGSYLQKWPSKLLSGNFIHIPIDGCFIEGNCTDFEFESSKDEINIKLIPFKEVEVS